MHVSPFHTRPWRTARFIAAWLPPVGLLVALVLVVSRPRPLPELDQVRFAADLIVAAVEPGGREGAVERVVALVDDTTAPVHGRLEDAVEEFPIRSFGAPIEGGELVRAERTLFPGNRPLRLVLEQKLAPIAGNGRVVATGVLTGVLGALLALAVGWQRGRRSARESAESAAALAAKAATGGAPSLEGPPPTTEIDEVARVAERSLLAAGVRLDELERQVREQQAIFQSMRSGLVALDPEQRLLTANRAARDMLGIDEPDVRGRLVQSVTRQPGLNRFLTEAIAVDAAVEAEFAVEREGRGRLMLQAMSEPLRDAAGSSAGLLVSLGDVTTLRRLESLRADFAANVSHELRTPITNIKGYVDTLLQVGVQDPEQARRFLEIVRRNAQRLGAIIEDLLALARLEQPGARESMEQADVPVRHLLEGVRENLGTAAQAKQIEIEDETPEHLCVRAMPSMAEQALANLVSNAITYSPPGATVRVTARPTSDGMVEIAVSDHGPGIAPHHLGRIFERFYRVDRARSREQGGTGLGLAIVKHIAQAHGGRVDVESRLGAGSTFRLVLPAGGAGVAEVAG